MTTADANGELIAELARLHQPCMTSTVAVIEEDGEERDIEPDSFEEITSRETVCTSCRSYPAWPCFEASLLMQHGVEFG